MGLLSLTRRNERVIDGPDEITLIDCRGRRRSMLHSEITHFEHRNGFLIARGDGGRKLAINLRHYHVPNLTRVEDELDRRWAQRPIDGA